MKNLKKIINALDKEGFSVYVDKNCGDITIGKYSPEGQDFSFTVDMPETPQQLFDEIFDYYDGFDASYEAYLWLDNTGHGTNGAPYDMGDVYDDMKACEQYIKDAAEIVREYI